MKNITHILHFPALNLHSRPYNANSSTGKGHGYETDICFIDSALECRAGRNVPAGI